MMTAYLLLNTMGVASKMSLQGAQMSFFAHARGLVDHNQRTCGKW